MSYRDLLMQLLEEQRENARLLGALDERVKGVDERQRDTRKELARVRAGLDEVKAAVQGCPHHAPRPIGLAKATAEEAEARTSMWRSLAKLFGAAAALAAAVATGYGASSIIGG